MPLLAHQIHRIAAPAWAPPVAHASDVGDAVATELATHERALRQAVHEAVVAYLTDASLTFDDDTFPSTRHLTGRYYLARRSSRRDGPHTVHVAVQVHCLGVLAGEDDHLGLEVRLRWRPGSAIFERWRNTDSSAI
jgi:hypothetical protein